ncbi:hypothetical protein T05_2050 [Trichinella murrelli]|uniref:Uncharacterized protein n=1 Tax=Trichinella murrelli TaxID=144512 RepID=A0A0V0UGJ9_9BILA|nr:hypothetical protein T05_2050 [Trichinella murrelli]
MLTNCVTKFFKETFMICCTMMPMFPFGNMIFETKYLCEEKLTGLRESLMFPIGNIGIWEQ